MKKTVVLLGVGSTYFIKGIMESIVKFGGEWDVRMVDIDQKCVDIAVNLGKRLVERYKANVKIVGTTDRCTVLEGADAVVSTIGVGGRRAWEKDVIMFREFNIYQSTGDTFGAGGISRGIRTIPVLLEIAHDMERLCPDALLVNFTNPMSVNCWALNKYTKIKTIGLCSGVTAHQHMLASLIGVPFEDTWCKAVGINHFTWITQFSYKGKDAWPLLKKALAEQPEVRAKNPYTWDLFDTFGAYPTVGDGHISEFIPGMQAKGAYYGKTMGVDAGHDFEKYAAQFDVIFQDMHDQAFGIKPLETRDDITEGDLFRDEDLFIDVLAAAFGDGPEIERTVNLPNNGLVTGLPDDCILEVTTHINDQGFHPYAFGKLPAGIHAIVSRIAASHALTVEAAVSADRNVVIQALMADCVALSRADAEKIANRIFEVHAPYLKHFKA